MSKCCSREWANRAGIEDWPQCQNSADCVALTDYGTYDVCEECVIFMEETGLSIEKLVQEFGEA